jgi:CheY-like chemotaxis protein
MPPILVVDDDDAIRATLPEVLNEHGFATIACETGMAALDILRTARQSYVVLLDIRMPEMTGWQVLHAVASEPSLSQRHAYILMTAMTAVAIPPAQMALISQTRAVIVAKPFDLPVLLAEIEAAAQRVQATPVAPQASP